MSTSKTYQQSLVDAGYETRPPMLERGSYMPRASRFQRYISRKRENRKWLNKAFDEGPYQFQMSVPSDSIRDALLHYDAKIELINLILLSILNGICNSVDACTSAKDMWHVVPIAVLTGSRLVSLNVARHVPTVVTQSSMKSLWPVKHVINKAHSPIQVSNGLGPQMTLSFLFDMHGNPQQALTNKCVIDSGNPKGGKISGKGKIKIGKLDFDDVYFVKEVKFNLFIVSQICDKKKNILFTDTECVVLSSDYKLPDENHVLLRFPRENNMYNVDLKNVVPSRDLTCLFAKATLDESNLWHRRLRHINFKTMNKLIKG
nr:ribonuclease H-like domain-containing protein [Tanacetum cinerariifolium]